MALIDELAALLARFDDAAFVALSNAGLLRRARKDLERTPPALIAADDVAVTYDAGGRTVTFDSRGPAGATCDCAASGVCQHVLSAALALRQRPRSPGLGTPSPHAMLMAHTHEALAAWAGRASFAAALEFLARNASEDDIAFSAEAGITISFARPPATVRYAGGGLDAAIVTHAVRDRKRLVAAAVLAYQRAHDVAVPEPDVPRATPREGELAAARGGVVRAVRALAAESVEIGLAHLSEAYEQRFVTLAVAATGAELYRLGLLLRRLADHVQGIAAHAARADEERLLDDMATAYALACAVGSHVDRGVPLPRYLAGEARAQYDEIGALELIGAGAFPWRTASGYVGLTVLFYAPESDRWMSWSEARPAFHGAFDPFARYTAPGPWRGITAPGHFAGARIAVRAAQVNRFGRIGAGSATSASVAATPDAAELRFGAWDFAVWRDLAARMSSRTSAIGLREANPHDAFAVVRPARFGAAVFDAVAQQLVWPLYDAAGDSIAASIGHGALTARTIERIEGLDAAQRASLTGLVGRVRANRGEISIEPIALLRRDEPHVDVLAFGTGLHIGEATSAAPSARAHEDRGAERVADVIDAALAPFGAALLRAAERGVGAALPETLRSEADRAARNGAAVFGATDRAPRSGEQVLRMRYIYGLCVSGSGNAALA
jgi:hypothetical protein